MSWVTTAQLAFFRNTKDTKGIFIKHIYLIIVAKIIKDSPSDVYKTQLRYNKTIFLILVHPSSLIRNIVLNLLLYNFVFTNKDHYDPQQISQLKNSHSKTIPIFSPMYLMVGAKVMGKAEARVREEKG